MSTQTPTQDVSEEVSRARRELELAEQHRQEVTAADWRVEEAERILAESQRRADSLLLEEQRKQAEEQRRAAAAVAQSIVDADARLCSALQGLAGVLARTQLQLGDALSSVRAAAQHRERVSQNAGEGRTAGVFSSALVREVNASTIAAVRAAGVNLQAAPGDPLNVADLGVRYNFAVRP